MISNFRKNYAMPLVLAGASLLNGCGMPLDSQIRNGIQRSVYQDKTCYSLVDSSTPSYFCDYAGSGPELDEVQVLPISTMASPSVFYLVDKRMESDGPEYSERGSKGAKDFENEFKALKSQFEGE